MKKTMIAICVAAMSIGGITLLSVNEAQATENTMETQGQGDGHCRKCGLKNGHYRCKAFCPLLGIRLIAPVGTPRTSTLIRTKGVSFRLS